MTECLRRLDPIDCEALASGEPPLEAPDAASHAASCPACAARVKAAVDFLREIETADLAGPGPGSDLVERVIRIRPFSRRERRDVRLWAGPAALSAGVFAAGVGFLAAPGLTAGDQTGVTLAALAPAVALARAAVRSIAGVFSASPDAWGALSEAFSRQFTWGIAALLLLAPAGLALRRVLARSPRRG